ncbi:hypothetical protein EYF80_043913 [Liparis tanakae]|uniref:Uncharacterized protein n=1 Tax=Liparis tanakae TaxID=230148 RepID=A0A4Z2FY20_9TELE|nr:hypothetical protein EYF80_043913 [Liparis tanakae]
MPGEVKLPFSSLSLCLRCLLSLLERHVNCCWENKKKKKEREKNFPLYCSKTSHEQTESRERIDNIARVFGPCRPSGVKTTVQCALDSFSLNAQEDRNLSADQFRELHGAKGTVKRGDRGPATLPAEAERAQSFSTSPALPRRRRIASTKTYRGPWRRRRRPPLCTRSLPGVARIAAAMLSNGRPGAAQS